MTGSPDHDADVGAEPLADVLSRFATGVVLLAAHAEDDDAVITATSFTSVSLDPPLVLVGITSGRWMHEVLGQAGRWTVSVLAERHRALAARFASGERPGPVTLLTGFPHRRSAVTGAVMLTDALATLDCLSDQHVEAGDHVLVVGRVLRTQGPGDGTPLVRYHHRYTGLRPR